MNKLFLFLVFLIGSMLLSDALMAQNNGLSVKSVLPLVDCNDIWGYAAPDGTEYALIGRRDGTSIVDLSDHDNPVEVVDIPGVETTWRDLKTWDHYAYVVNEKDEGLLIINLEDLPGSAEYLYWQGDSAFLTAHNIFIDENGFAYLFGYDNVAEDLATEEKGALILDLNVDGDYGPTNPKVVGAYNTNYVHDGFVRGDTLWTSEIYQGTLTVVDISDKANPEVLSSVFTPNNFTHNNWPSDDNQYMYTTDERSGAFVTAYDVSDIYDMVEVDRYQSSPGDSVIPHNAFFKDDFVFISYYADGVVALDVTYPDVMTEVGKYDTAPEYEGGGYSGCWGVYPYLPSGYILGSDRQEGLYVLEFDYERGAYLDGIVTAEDTGDPINNAYVQILDTDYQGDNTNFLGEYDLGISDEGSFIIEVSAPGYVTQQIEVEFVKNEKISQDFVLALPEAAPVPAFSFSETEICSEDFVYFYDESSNFPNYWYWDFPEASPSISSIANPKFKFTESGTYTFTYSVANSLGTVSITDSISVIIHDEPSFDLAIADVSCPGETDGAALIENIEAEGDYVINWSNGASDTTIINMLPKEDYWVEVISEFACVTRENFTITQPQSISLTVDTNPANIGADNGMAGVTIQGGTAPFSVTLNTIDGNVVGFYPEVNSVDEGAAYLLIEDLVEGSYTVYIEDENGCVKNTNFAISSITAIEDSSVTQLLLYPNPVTTELVLQYNILQDQGEEIHIYDVMGKELVNYSMDIYNGHTVINMEKLSAGIYFVALKTNNETLVQKVLKN